VNPLTSKETQMTDPKPQPQQSKVKLPVPAAASDNGLSLELTDTAWQGRHLALSGTVAGLKAKTAALSLESLFFKTAAGWVEMAGGEVLFKTFTAVPKGVNADESVILTLAEDGTFFVRNDSGRSGAGGSEVGTWLMKVKHGNSTAEVQFEHDPDAVCPLKPTS